MRKKEKNILIICQTTTPRSGAGRLAYEICIRLTAKSTVVVLAETPGENSDIPVSGILAAHSRIAGFIKNCIQARKAAKNAAVVHAMDAWPYGVYGYCAVLGTKKKLIINGVGTYSVAPLYNKKSSFLVRAAYRRATAIPCISNYTKKRLDAAMPNLPTHVVYMGTTKLPVPSTDEVESMRKRLYLSAQVPVLLTVGNIQDRKGQRETLKGVIACKEVVPNLHYVVVGNDSDMYADDIRKLAKEHGVFENLRIVSTIRTDRELATCYALANIFALNSINDKLHFEGFGLVFLEAAQFGVPAIGSKDCGIEDAINNGVSGILTPQRDATAIGTAIVCILQNEERFKKGAQDWFTRFSWDTMVKQLYTYYGI